MQYFAPRSAANNLHQTLHAARRTLKPAAANFRYLILRDELLPNREETDPSWSPDGDKMAFVASTSGTDREIWTMDADGTNQQRIHTHVDHDINPDWQQDSTPPNTTVTSGPPSITNSTSAGFSFVSSETGSTFECSLDGAAFTACVSPKGYAVANGSHTFSVRATDVADNVDATPAVHTWTVDTIKPTITPVSPGNASTTRDTTPTIKATVRDNLANLQKANVKLYLNNVPISPTKWSYNASTDAQLYNSPKLSKGKKTVKIVATDTAGNALTRSWYFTIR